MFAMCSRFWRSRTGAASWTCCASRTRPSATWSPRWASVSPACPSTCGCCEAGLVEVRADAQRRVYRLRTEPLREIDEWLAPYRAAWAGRLGALEAHLDDMDN